MEHKYKDLKGVIKEGHKVRAVKVKCNGCSKLNNDGSNTQIITEVESDGFCINGCFHSYKEGGFLEIVDEEITWDTLKAGDYIKRDTIENKILGVDGENVFYEAVFLKVKGAFIVYGRGIEIRCKTKEYLKEKGYTIIQPKKEKPVYTPDEAIDKLRELGHDCEIKK